LTTKRWIFLLPLAFLFATLSSPAQTSKSPDPLFVTVKSLDAKLFDAYNHCDLETLGAMVSDDLEFYHDQTGLTVGKAPFLTAIKQNICGKLQRSLLEETVEVYPLNGYGAVEIGIHRFHHPNDPGNVGDAKFIHLWHNDNGVWKLTRVISYEHNQGLLAKWQSESSSSLLNIGQHV
jgi:ketosteroid isomerase-like protein